MSLHSSAVIVCNVVGKSAIVGIDTCIISKYHTAIVCSVLSKRAVIDYHVARVLHVHNSFHIRYSIVFDLCLNTCECV